MDPKKTINMLIQIGLYTQADRQSFINDTAPMKSTREVFNYLVNSVGNTIDDQIEFVKEQGLKEEMRKLFRPEIQFWFLKIQIAETFGAEVNDPDILEIIDSILRQKHHEQRKKMLSQLYKQMAGEQLEEGDMNQICEQLQEYNFLFEELKQKQKEQESGSIGGEDPPVVIDNEQYLKDVEERIKRTNLENERQYYEELREDLTDVPENVIDYKLKKAEIDLGERYLDQEGSEEPKLTESIKELLTNLKLTDTQAKKAKDNILLKEEDIRRNLKIIRKCVCGIDILDMLRMIEKGRKQEKKTLAKMEKQGKKMRVLLFFGLSKAGKTTLITRLMGYDMEKIRMDGIFTIQPKNPENMKPEHKELVIGYSNRSTTRYPKLYKVPNDCLPDDEDNDDYDTFCMDSAGLEDAAGVQVEGSNRITMIQLLKKIHKLQIIVVINQKNWGTRGADIQKLAKTTSSILKDFTKIRKSVKFVFNNFDQEFKQSFHANVKDLYNNIQNQGQSVIDENYKQFFNSLKNQTKNQKEMATVDILNLNIRDFYQRLFSNVTFIEDTQYCFITDIGPHCKAEIKKLVQRCKNSFYEQYKLGHIKQAQYYIDLLNKIASQPKFQSGADLVIDQMKGTIKHSLEKQINQLNVEFEQLQISSIKNKESREKKFQEVYELYKDLKTKIKKYQELDKHSELDHNLEDKVGEAVRWYEAKLNDWNEKVLNRIQDRVDCTINAQEFMKKFASQEAFNKYRATLAKHENEFMEIMQNEIMVGNEEHEIAKYLKLCCAIQEAQGKDIDYSFVKKAIADKFQRLKQKVSLIDLNLDQTPGENQPQMVRIGPNEEKDIENVENLLNYIKIVEIYPNELVDDRQKYKRIYEFIVMKVPGEYKKRFMKVLQTGQRDDDDDDKIEQQSKLKDADDRIEKIKILIKTLNILNKIKTIKNYHEESLVDQYNGLQDIIASLFKKFEKMATAFHNNEPSQIRRNVKTMRSQLKRLSDLVKITNKMQLQTRLDNMRDDLGESIRAFMNANDINENITFKNTASLFKAFEKYNKLKEFQEIPKVIESEELKKEMENMINRIQQRIIAPIISMQKEMETRKTFYTNKLDCYLAYIDVLDNQGTHIFRADFRQRINDLQNVTRTKIQQIYSDSIVKKFQELNKLIEDNMGLDEENIKEIMDKLPLQQTEKYRKAIQMMADLRENPEIKEQFFTDLDHHWGNYIDKFRSFKNAAEEKVESLVEVNTLDKLKKISNLFKNIEMRNGDEPKIFEDLLTKITFRMKDKAEDEKQSIQRLLKNENSPENFEAEMFKRVYGQLILNKTEFGRKNAQNLEEYFEGYRNKVQKKLDNLKVQMLDIEEGGFGRKILEFFKGFNQYNKNLTLIASKAGENSPFNGPQYKLSNMQTLLSYFDTKLLQYSSSLQVDFMYMKQGQMKKQSRNLQEIETEIEELLKNEFKLPKYQEELERQNIKYLSENLMKKKNERKEKLSKLNQGGLIDKIDDDFTKLLKCLKEDEKKKLQTLAREEISKHMDDLNSIYYEDYTKYQQQSKKLKQKTAYLDKSIQDDLSKKYQEVVEKISEKNASDFQEIQQKKLDEIDHFLELSKNFQKSKNISNIQKLAAKIKAKSNEFSSQESLEFLKNKLWDKKDYIINDAQPEAIQNEWKKIQNKLLIDTDKLVTKNINKIQTYYKNPALAEDSGDSLSDISNTNRKMKLSQIVDCQSAFQSACEQSNFIVDDNRKKIEELVNDIKEFFDKMVGGGEVAIEKFQNITNDILGHQDIIQGTFIQIREYQTDFKNLVAMKQFYQADRVKISLNKLRNTKENLFQIVNEIMSKQFVIYSTEVRENDEEQDNKRVQEFQNDIQKLNVLMNHYNACLSPPSEKQIKMNEIKQKIDQVCEKIPDDYQKQLDKNIKEAADDKALDKRLNYIPKIVNIIKGKPRKYLVRFNEYFEKCQDILKAEINKEQASLGEAVEMLVNYHTNKDKAYEDFKEAQKTGYENRIEKLKQDKTQKIAGINKKYSQKFENEKDENQKKKIKEEWESAKKEAEFTSNKLQNEETEKYQERLKNNRQKSSQEDEEKREDMIMKLIAMKKLAGISIINQQVDVKVQQKLKKLKKSPKIIRGVFLGLEKSDNPVATRVLDEHQVFSKLRGQKFNEQTKATNSGQYILDQMLNNRHISHVQHEEFLSLYKRFDREQNQYIRTFQQLKDKSVINQLTLKIKIQGEEFSKDHQQKQKDISPSKRVQLLAKIFALWSISSSQEEANENQQEDFTVCYKAHAAQILCVIMILCMDDSNLANKLITCNRLAEVKTGEGKSIVLASLSTFFALFGYEVHCACYSLMLSRRDQQQFTKLFTLCGVKDKIHYGIFEHIIKKVLNQKDDKDNKEERFEEVIKEMLVEKAEGGVFNWIKNKVGNLFNFISKFKKTFSSNDEQKPKKILIIDEIDVLFNKDYYGDTFNQSIDLRDETIANLFKFIWANKNNNQMGFEFIKKSSEFQKVVVKFKSLQKILQNQINGMVAALTTYKDQNYAIIDRRIMYKVEDSFMEVSYRYNTVYAYLQEFDNSKVSEAAFYENMTINLCVAEFSYAKLPEYYKGVLGVTGTLTCLPQYIKNHLSSKYKISQGQCFPIPSVYGSNTENRQILAPMCVNREKLFETVVDNIQENFSKQRPVLVFFRNKVEMLEFYNSNEYKKFQQFTSYITEEHSHFERSQKIKNSSLKNTITLMTSSFIRGTDFKLYNKKALEAGGFHAIVTYLIDSPADYIQATGRIARQGKPGSFIQIYQREDLQILDIDMQENEPIRLVKNKRLQKQEKEKESCEQKLKASEKRHDQTINVFQNPDFNQDILIKYVAKKNKFPKLIKTSKKARLILMVDATISMSDLFAQLKIFLPQIFDDTYQTLNNEKFPGCLEMQLVLYRNYNSDVDKILEISTFDSQGEVLKNFISKSQVSGGWGNEAIEVALQYVNTLQDVNEIILIGDVGGNSPQQIRAKRAQYQQLQNKRIQNGMTPTTTEDQINKLIQKKVKVSGFYLRNTTPIRNYFEGISRQTYGEARPINIYDKNASQEMTQFIVNHALKMIGGQGGQSDALLAAYAKILNKRMGK